MALKSGRVGIHPSQVDPITGMLINGPTPGSISFEDLSDAQISNPEVGQTLIYNGTGWENEFSSISPTTLAALQDVQITDPEDGDYLVYDEENSKWINSGEAPAPTYTDITVTIHGAVEDTISFTDAAGISHSEVFASGLSSKTVTFKINPSGSTSITFTSAVAKDPDNLSNDYTKTVSVTSVTTEIKVMPDNALYWWGYESANLEDLSTANGWNGGMVSGLPTHNDYDISFANSGVGAKQAVTPSKAYIICKSTSLYDGQHGMQLQGYTAKNNVNGTEIMVNKTQNVVNTVQCVSTDCTGQSGYPYSRTPNLSASGNLYAFWYE